MNATIPLNSRSIWHRQFLLLFSSTILKVTADQFAAIAFIWLLLESGGDATSTTLLYMSNLLPILFFGVLASPFLAKGKVTHWMFSSDSIRALLILVVPLAHLMGQPPLWLFFVSAFLQSACGAIYNPASVSLLPRIVSSDQVQKGNALLQSANQMVRLLGLAGAGMMVSLLSAATTLVITAALLCLSAFLLLFIHIPAERSEDALAQTNKKTEQASKGLSGYLGNLQEGFRALRQHRAIHAMAWFFAFENIGIAPLFTLLAVYVQSELHGEAALFATLQGSQAFGALLVGFMLAKVNIKRQGALFIGAAVVESIAVIGLGASPWIWSLVLCSIVFGMTMTAINVPEMVIIQTTVPKDQQAAVFAAVTTISVLFLPIASLLIGPLAARFGAGTLIAAGGVFALLCCASVLVNRNLIKLKL
ncbi:MFS transporter [Brevibacillus fluminis]|uniref:MFS transporter n=1 Tax=Brevibacillus fluminis TaxID=511487 RepID=A0A3M8DBN2_9BACL|nr:MFS transporter [Brevibacillus fluminis]RNB85398.1 MFS transporter [Brevibacillus fluminis]